MTTLKLRYLLLALVPLAVAGCITAEEEDQNNCSSYGFRPGTDAFANCMMQQGLRHDDERRRYMDVLEERRERKHERKKERRRREQSQIDTRPQFDRDGNPNFDTQGNYTGCHGMGCEVDNPDDG
ncbi:hypothetical protein M8997_011735 [Phyllobacterium sp. 21LDTY02-6]|jgi:Spy/CpxP family protein refolding chaperone|uniref:hypothetical protein n=1 Tax=unclassified Phyllobacterium TaxID=2638441 RepID=UPI00202157DF|nr:MULTISPECIES: hypothetical protein [unclassified Phyllobacterium]MCO4317853.1 hypothetical protein [Phyllobacterium sp. 21LDTY02-6]MCX8282036.1 hypothetical protein [Phyllobacterium sp. 0TCS1.6C]MCX8296272.1 hypothetical protein [Phyllobacterium sp. 0TCS1.6A]